MTRDRIVIEPTAGTGELRAEIARLAARRGFRRFLLPNGEPAPEGAGIAVLQRKEDGVPFDDGAIRPVVPVRDPTDLSAAVAAGRKANGVVIAWSAERVIPLENLISEAHGRFPVWVLVDRLRDVPAMLGALEHGADRLIVAVAGAADLELLESALDEVRADAVPWELVPVSHVAPAGMGDRVIVDTTSLLRPREGLLVGSSAAFLFHVASEAVGSRFTRPRPFRINAGAPHSYTLLADGTTRYLSELVPGDSVLVAEPHGHARAVRVGRLKIERRPLVRIEAEHGGRRFTVFLQEAETVRLSGEHAALPTTEITSGQRVFAARFPPARHLGAVVDESIDER